MVLLDPDRWQKHLLEDEECLCDTPHLEWCLSPLGAPVELGWGSANHRLCRDTDPLRHDLLPHAHPGIVAEAHYARGDINAFVAIITADPRAADHVLSLPIRFESDGALKEAQHCVRASRACDAARNALDELNR